jgi:Cu(I)/Ag(I) efflux system membrane fusion protein
MKKVLLKYKKFFKIVLAAALIFSAACRNKTHTAEQTHATQKEVWTCSMHPEIIRDQPGNCPICGMELIKKVENATVIKGIRLDELLQPADQFVVSSIPLTALTYMKVEPEIKAWGTINYDTRLINTISARVSGRIEKMWVRYRYQHVTKGERLMDIYSPELLTAEQELLFLIQHDPDNISLINAAKQKLLYLGMNENQLQQVIHTQKLLLTISIYSNYSGHLHESGNTMPGPVDEPGKMNASITEELPVKEGMYIQKGQIIFQIFSMDKSWVLLSIFPETESLVKRGNQVRIIPEAAPEKEFRAKIDFIEPFFRNNNKTLTARVYFDNAALQLPVGSQVRATVYSDALDADWLPRSAVLSLGFGKVVFIRAAGGFKAHKIETGILNQNFVQVLSGLSQTDSVAANAQYLTDSEGFIKTNDQP